MRGEERDGAIMNDPRKTMVTISGAHLMDLEAKAAELERLREHIRRIDAFGAEAAQAERERCIRIVCRRARVAKHGYTNLEHDILEDILNPTSDGEK
jgi:hypothetical protein